jgi:hypothetical protein
MRPYPSNSGQSAARIVALAMLADGHLSRQELQVLDQADTLERLGLDRDAWQQVLHDLCEDLQCKHHLSWAQACQVDVRSLTEVLDEITDPALRRHVLQLCRSVVESDGLVTEDEWVVMACAVDRWCLHYEVVAGDARVWARGAGAQ